MLAIRLRQPKHLTPPKSQQRRCLGGPDPAIRQIAQHAHPVDLRPTHRNHRHRPNTPQLRLRRVTSLSGPTVTSLSGVYKSVSRNVRLWNGLCYTTSSRAKIAQRKGGDSSLKGDLSTTLHVKGLSMVRPEREPSVMSYERDASSHSATLRTAMGCSLCPPGRVDLV